MDLVHERSAGIDMSKRDAKLAIRAPGKRAGTFTTTVTTWGSTTSQILALRRMLLDEPVTTVLVEATSDCRKPFHYLFGENLPVMLATAKAARNLRRPQDRCFRRGLAGPAGRARAAAGLLRAARTDPGTARPHPRPNGRRPGPHP
jgi:hypothetical protein